MNDWIKEAPIGVTVCGRDGKITAMNLKAGRIFEKSGGLALVGANLLDCHPEPAKTKLKEMLDSAAPVVNAYTIEKNGVKKLIYQFSCSANGEPAGLVELSLELPAGMPHFVRK